MDHRRIEIIAFDEKTTDFIFDPTVRFEIDEAQLLSVDVEKKRIYTNSVFPILK